MHAVLPFSAERQGARFGGGGGGVLHGRGHSFPLTFRADPGHLRWECLMIAYSFLAYHTLADLGTVHK